MNLSGLGAIWQREMLTFFREKPRIVSAVVNPLFWLLTFGVGLGSTVNIQGIDYEQYIFAGILLQTILFSSIFYGAYLMWDRRIDLLKAVLVTPLNRSLIFLGKVLGGVTFSAVEAAIILIFGLAINIHYTLYSFSVIMITVVIAAAALTAFGLTIGSLMTSPEGFQLLTTFVVFPLFFLSGALFPLDNLPPYLSILTVANPLTYIVDLLRSLLVGLQYFGTLENVLVTVSFAAIAAVVGALAFRRMRA